jgi:hypothetical protein
MFPFTRQLSQQPLPNSVLRACPVAYRHTAVRYLLPHVLGVGLLTACVLPIACLLAPLGHAAGSGDAGSGDAGEVDYAREIRPVLSQFCFKCHGPDEQARQGGLRLDIREQALVGGDSGRPAIDLQSVGSSELLRRIRSQDPDEVMPPPHTKQTLSDEQLRRLSVWVEQGAAYVDHWAFQPATTVLPPAANAAPAAGAATHSRNAIDAFVAAAAARRGFELEGPADAGTWLRRASLDLTGLPPSYEDVVAFRAEERPDARERAVDRLLSSPAFGERWTRRWLDLARYADTNGYEKDRPRSIWPYRDWVIRAINDDLPLDAFAIQQLAGDLLPAATPDAIVATGFHRNTMINEEGGIDPLEYRFYAMVDRVNTTGTIWLGMTVGCAQCHDHKYDPFSQRDYYAMMALLNDTEEPEFEVPDQEILATQRRIDEEIQQRLAARADAFPLHPDDLRWVPANVQAVQSLSGVQWSRRAAGAFLSQAVPAGVDVDTTRVVLEVDEAPGHRTLVAVRLRAVSSASEPGDAPATPKQPQPLGWSDSGNFVITHASLDLVENGTEDTTQQPKNGTQSLHGAESVRKLKLAAADATYSQAGYPAAGSLDATPRSGWAVDGRGEQVCEITWTLAEPHELGAEAIGRFQLSLEQQFGGRHLLRGFEIELGVASVTGDALATSRTRHLEERYRQWLLEQSGRAVAWRMESPARTQANEARLLPQPDGSLLAIGDITKRDWYALELPELRAGTRAIMLEALPDPLLPRRGPGRTYYEGPIGDFFLSEVTLQDNQERPVAIADAVVDFAAAGREAALALDGNPLTGWAIDGGQGQPHRMILRLAEPLTGSQTLTLTLLFERYYASPMGRLRIWSTTEPVDVQHARWTPETQNAWFAAGAISATGDTSELRELFLSHAPELAGVNADIQQRRQARPRLPTTLVMQPRPTGFSRTTFRYHRGEFLNPREVVEPAGPAFLRETLPTAPSNRLELAQWLMHPRHPLTSRVLANRYWANLFGRGLVATEEDFGFQGAFPSDPLLLDWLATELVGQRFSTGLTPAVERASSPASGGSAGETLDSQELMWSFKRWVRQVVLSETYGRSGTVPPALLAADPGNESWARGSRRRLEGEQLRDAALSAAGLLTRQIGGPSVYPPQSAAITTEGTYGGLNWPTSSGADRYRRGLYTFAKRTAPFAMLQTFDAPSGESCVARRESTDTPLQALVVLNDEALLEAAQELGRLAVIASNTHSGVLGGSPAQTGRGSGRQATSADQHPQERAISGGSISDKQSALPVAEERPQGGRAELERSAHETVQFLFARILLREPSEIEAATLLAYYQQQYQALLADRPAAVQLTHPALRAAAVEVLAAGAAGTLAARVLLNTDEFINRN